ncbi:oligosaccharide flippase family protein [Methanocaldococcus sp. 16A]
MGYEKRAIKGISWNFLLIMLAAPIGYAVRMLYSHEIPKLEVVGLFYAVLDFYAILGIFRDLGLSSALVRFIPEFLHKNLIP